MTFGRVLFALGLIGLAIDHFIFQEFVVGRAPAWPASVPGRAVWAYLTGAVFVVTGVAILTGKGGRGAAILAAALVFFWALLRHAPVVVTESLFAPSWTRAGKALTFFGGALAVAGTFRKEGASRGVLEKLLSLGDELILLGRVCLGTFLVITGVQHFIYTGFVASLIPGWFPGDAVWWTRFAGVALIAGGLGLLVPRTARLAALLSGLMVFCWFWIVHVPRTFTSVSDGIAVFEALAVSGIAFVIAGSLHPRRIKAGRQEDEV